MSDIQKQLEEIHKNLKSLKDESVDTYMDALQSIEKKTIAVQEKFMTLDLDEQEKYHHLLENILESMNAAMAHSEEKNQALLKEWEDVKAPLQHNRAPESPSHIQKKTK